MKENTRKVQLRLRLQTRLHEIEQELISTPPTETQEAYQRRVQEAIYIRDMLEILEEKDNES